MRKKVRLSKEQVLSIPEKLKESTPGEIGIEFGVSRESIMYWIRKLRTKGVVLTTRKRGPVGLLE